MRLAGPAFSQWRRVKRALLLVKFQGHNGRETYASAGHKIRCFGLVETLHVSSLLRHSTLVEHREARPGGRGSKANPCCHPRSDPSCRHCVGSTILACRRLSQDINLLPLGPVWNAYRKRASSNGGNVNTTGPSGNVTMVNSGKKYNYWHNFNCLEVHWANYRSTH